MSLKLILHPLAKPVVDSDPVFQSIYRDIAANGQLVPVLGIAGRTNGDVFVFEGAKRMEACKRLGIAVKHELWSGSEEQLPSIIASLKLCREHLSTSQRAAIASVLEPRFADAARMRSGVRNDLKSQKSSGKSNLPANLPGGSKGSWDPFKGSGGDTWTGEAREFAGDLFGVSARSVQDCKTILAHSPKLHAQLIAGEININQAMAEIRRQDRLRDLRTVRKTIARPSDGSWEIQTGDCLKLLPTLKRRRFRLIFADPPYNQGVDYGNGRKCDQLSATEYLQLTEEWISQCVELLTPDGSLWVMISDEWAAHYWMILELRLKRRAWIKWYYKFGENSTVNFNFTSRHIFYYCRDPKRFVFEKSVFETMSARAALYADKRGAINGGKLMDNVWDIPMLCGNNPERIPTFPTQLPLALVSKIVEGATEVGDEVLDPFSGSGTTGAAAIACGRKYFGIEINPEFADLSRARLSQQSNQKKN